MRPDFVVIGGMKCGTTALWHYLRMHPEIYLPLGRKNLYFFIEQDNWGKGIDWYESYFHPDSGNIKAIGEISTEYAKYPSFAGVAPKMASIVPDAKLIYLVRHPIKRIISQYIHMVNAGKELRDINKALENTIDNPYIEYSRYWLQLSQYLEYYPKENIFLLTSEELRGQPAETLGKLFEFIGVDSGFEPEEEVNIHTRSEKKQWNLAGRLIKRSPALFNYYNYYLSKMPYAARKVSERLVSKTIDNPQITERTLSRLTRILAPDVEKLGKYVGKDMNMWELEKI